MLEQHRHCLQSVSRSTHTEKGPSLLSPLSGEAHSTDLGSVTAGALLHLKKVRQPGSSSPKSGSFQDSPDLRQSFLIQARSNKGNTTRKIPKTFLTLASNWVTGPLPSTFKPTTISSLGGGGEDRQYLHHELPKSSLIQVDFHIM